MGNNKMLEVGKEVFNETDCDIIRLLKAWTGRGQSEVIGLIHILNSYAKGEISGECINKLEKRRGESISSGD